MILRRTSRWPGRAAALALALAPAAVEAAAAAPAVTCPDQTTVQAARLVEFQTMMMGVAVRCRHVGVPISEHLEGMNAARRTTFTEASDRVATYLRSLNTRFGPATAPQAAQAKPAAKVSRRVDPYDRYLTMIGNQYGAGMTTPQRCKAFDAILMSLSEQTNSDRLLTMVAGSLVQVTLLEAIVNCPPGK